MAVAVARTVRTGFTCEECGASAPKWQGKCPSCEAWNSLVEDAAPRPAGRSAGAPGVVVPLADALAEAAHRLSSGFVEVDRVLGGGLVPGSVVLLGGDPGVGKSTLALQVLARMQREALYCSGEESGAQVALRASRVGAVGEGLQLLVETELDAVLATIEAWGMRTSLITPAAETRWPTVR